MKKKKVITLDVITEDLYALYNSLDDNPELIKTAVHKINAVGKILNGQRDRLKYQINKKSKKTNKFYE